jgi:hypothetical protein
MHLIKMQIVTSMYKFTTTPDAKHFTHSTLTRSLWITQTKRDVCMHTPYRIQMAVSLYLKWLTITWF